MKLIYKFAFWMGAVVNFWFCLPVIYLWWIKNFHTLFKLEIAGTDDNRDWNQLCNLVDQNNSRINELEERLTMKKGGL